MPKIRAAVLHGVNDLRVHDWDLPEEIPEGHVRIAIKKVGICQSDVHFWCAGRIANFILKDPMVIGHECAGVVTATGSGVKNLRVGDRVAIEPGIPCWGNVFSRQGRYNLDPNIKFFATPPVNGSLADQIDHPEEWCFKIPENVSLEEGAMCEPLSVGVHACKRAGVCPGKTVAILGSGPIGLVTLMAAKAFGADLVTITGLQQHRLDLAKELGADGALLVKPTDTSEEIAENLRSYISGYSTETGSSGIGFDIVIDCAGFEATIRNAVSAIAPGGRIVVVGFGQEEVSIPLADMTIREVELLGSFRFDETGVAEGFTAARDAGSSGAIKVMFNLE